MPPKLPPEILKFVSKIQRENEQLGMTLSQELVVSLAWSRWARLLPGSELSDLMFALAARGSYYDLLTHKFMECGMRLRNTKPRQLRKPRTPKACAKSER